MLIATSENRYKKIAIVTTIKNPLSENEFLMHLCKKLSASGIETDVFARASGDALQPRVINWDEKVRIINILAAEDVLADVFTDEVRSYAKRNHIRYDVLHALSIEAAYVCAAINDMSGIPYIVNMEKYDPAHDYVVSQAEKIILSNNRTKQQLVQAGYDVNKLAIIKNGFDPLDFYPVPSGKAKKHLNIVADGGLLLYIKNSSIRKNEMVYNAFLLAKERQRNLKMIVLTDQNDNTDIPGEIITVHTESKELTKYYYAAADLFVTTECDVNNNPSTIFEVMGCGTPVLGVGEGMKSCISNGKTGFIIPSWEADAIAHKMVHVLRDKELMADMQLNTVIEAHSMHTWKRTTRLVESMYRKIAQTPQETERKSIEPILLTLDLTHPLEERAIA